MGVVAPRRRPAGAGWAIAGACLALAALSLLAPFALIYDAWSWSLWARQLAHGSLDTAGLTAWKPLPPLVGAPVALLGGSPGVAWLLVERAAALGALALAYALAARRAGWVGGALAVALLVLVSGWLRFAAEGYSEPVVVVLLLGGLLAWLERRPAWALAALTGAALLRPEAWPLLLLAVAWLWRDAPRLRWALGGVLVLVVVTWFGGEWLGSGDPLAGSQRARDASVAGSTTAGLRLPLAVTWIGVLAALWWGGRRRDPGVLLPAGVALLWTLTVLLMEALGYPGIERFVVPAAALWCVVGAIGLVWLVGAARAHGAAAAAATVAVLVAVAVLAAIPRVEEIGDDADRVAERIDAQEELRDAVALVGRDRLAAAAPCVNVAFHSALAWELDVRATQVCAPLAPPVEGCSTYVLRTGDRRVTGPAPPAGPREVGRAGRWSVSEAAEGQCQEP